MNDDLILTPGDADILQKNIALMESSINVFKKLTVKALPPAYISSMLHDALHKLFVTVNSTGALALTHNDFTLQNSVITAEKANAMYAITEELIVNILKHSNAKKAAVFINPGKTVFTLIVSDDGKGFNPAVLPMATGKGYKNIYGYIKQLNAAITIQGAPVTGTQVIITIPQGGPA